MSFERQILICRLGGRSRRIDFALQLAHQLSAYYETYFYLMLEPLFLRQILLNQIIQVNMIKLLMFYVTV